MIIVAGYLVVRPERRAAFVEASLSSVAQARATAGCHDFVVAADPLDDSRVNVFERWESDAALEAFRGEGPGDELVTEIVRADVKRYRIAATEPA